LTRSIQDPHNAGARLHLHFGDVTDEPGDYATGESWPVRDFLEEAARRCGVDWRRQVQTDLRYVKPTEVDHADSTDP
jgi:hypothetical protein